MSTGIRAYRSKILHFLGDPEEQGDQAYEFFEDGILLVEDGYVINLGPSEKLLPDVQDQIPLEHYPNHLIVPGLIDTHIHYPQTQMIGAHGDQLLEWLTNYTFPTEMAFADIEYSRKVSKVFLDELLRNGTTTALVFATVHPESVEAFFTEAQARNLRMIAGKVLMDRNAPEALCDTAEQGYQQSKALIQRWHNVDRLLYAVTPRFAPTCSAQQLQKAGELLQEFPDVYLHTHLAENEKEIAWVKSLFPNAENYLAVYQQANLLKKRSIFAHGIHLCDQQCQLLAEHNAAVAHCPTSNLFLGSGLFNLQKLQKHKINIGLGTDVGAGTSFSLFKTMDEAYKVQQLQGHSLNAMSALYLATLGGAKALDLDDKIGNFKINNEADFLILDLAATPLLQFRTQHCSSINDLIFVLNTLGDDRLVAKTFAMGQCVHQRDGDPT